MLSEKYFNFESVVKRILIIYCIIFKSNLFKIYGFFFIYNHYFYMLREYLLFVLMHLLYTRSPQG